MTDFKQLNLENPLEITLDPQGQDFNSSPNILQTAKSIVVGEGNTRATIDSFTGVVEHKGVYGELYVLAQTSSTVIAGAGTFVQYTEFDNAGESNRTVPRTSDDDIIIVEDGKYLVTCSIHAESDVGGAADVISCEIRKNNGATAFANLHAHRKLAGGGGDMGSISISGIVHLYANDTLELWVTNDDNATNFVIADCTLSAVKIAY